jgi:hypothetical protein
MTIKRSRHDENLEYRARMGQLSKAAYSVSTVKIWNSGNTKIRHPGASLKASEIPQLVENALAGDGPIKHGEAFEHFLAVVCDNYRFHTYHFIVAASRQAGGRRRAILLSERTLHGSTDHGKEREYAQRLEAYASELGSPRIMILDHSFNCALPREFRKMGSSMLFSKICLQTRPACELLRATYRDCYAPYIDRYKQGIITKDIKCPSMEGLSQVSTLNMSVDSEGLVELAAKNPRVERELEAICLLSADEEDERLGFPRDTYFRPGTYGNF